MPTTLARDNNMNTCSSTKEEIARLITQYYNLEKREVFIPGETMIRYAGRVYDQEEMIEAVNAVLDFWLTLGPRAEMFEKELATLLRTKNVLLTNSGSSANLIAVSSLTSLRLKNHLRKGDEAITPAATFPTTFNPIIQNNLTPVLVDIELGTYNPSYEQIARSVTKDTKLIVLPHTLGNPNEMDAIMDLAEERDLFVIEDACDALGSSYDGKMVGTFGNFGTFSFYPAHHITMGEGGAVITNDDRLFSVATSFRDWGRACVCSECKLMISKAPCPLGFKTASLAKYIYTEIGYNLRPTDIQAALGIAQLRKLPRFVESRKRNFRILYEEFHKYESYFILPESLPKADPCWFAFPLTVRDNLRFRRDDLIKWYEKCRIETRLLFAGNIVRQPAYRKIAYQKSGGLNNSDQVMTRTFFLGIYPGIDNERMTYVAEKTAEFISNYG